MIYRNKKESVALSFAKMQSAMSCGGGMPTVMITIKDNKG